MRPTGPTHDAIARERALIAAHDAIARERALIAAHDAIARERALIAAAVANVVAARREAVHSEESRQSQVREWLERRYSPAGRRARGVGP